SGSAVIELVTNAVLPSGISIFRTDASALRPAAALNQDGTINSPDHPAKPGSTIVLFGTGGGQTDPPSDAGEVTPLALRRLGHDLRVQIQLGAALLKVEYAGAAPGLIAGVD